MGQPQLAQWEWKRVVPQILSMIVLAGVFFLALPGDQKQSYIYYAAACYLIYTIGSNLLIPVYHRKGVKALEGGRYEEAIRLFEKSKSFFERHAWLDKYRPITMMSPTVASYRELAMTNIAFSYAQQGRSDLAKEMYQEVLREYPDNRVANAIAELIAGLGDNGK